MISLDLQADTPSGASHLGLFTKENVSTLSFSELLKGISLQNANFTSPLASPQEETLQDKKVSQEKLSKTKTLLSLLNADADIQAEGKTLKIPAPLALNPQLGASLSIEELKTLIIGAKQYLKNKIIQSDGFKKAEIASLPKTLKGLTQVAEKLGIELSKITLENVAPQLTKPTVIKTATKTIQSHKDTQTQDKVQTTHAQESTSIKGVLHETLKKTPLFKAQAQTEHTTEQIVQTKILSNDKKLPQKKADETLKSLLSGDKTLKKETTLTADFSVASAKVLAPKTTKEQSNAFESLLKGEHKDTADSTKIQGQTVPKADSFEVKLHEAKQMTKYISQDIKQAIEDYKSPFTRVKVQLNPQKLGEVDLTIVQRGKNLHINLSSNNVAINTLATNAHELKTQLANNGINNASLNFNNNSQGDQSGANQQQQRHQEQKAHDEYNYFEKQESGEEVLSSLEIVVPHYA